MTALSILNFGPGKLRMPPRLSQNFLPLNTACRTTITRALHQHFFQADTHGALATPEYLSSPEGQKDFNDHLHQRLDNFRRVVIPWLNDAMPLAGKRILEIGCGTGSSTVALLEQNARVTAVDIDIPSLAVAKERCAAYGLKADFHRCNATDVHEMFQNEKFDFVIFLASVEHMTHAERISAMKTTWNMLPKGGMWAICETPNRLWCFDGHTSHLPFFHWLPDEFAFEYSRFSPRAPFNTSFRTLTPESMLSFLREGRGVSYHEFNLAMPDAEVVNCLDEMNPLRNLLRRLRRTFNYRYENFLAEVGPKIHRGFYKGSLDMVFRKSQ